MQQIHLFIYFFNAFIYFPTVIVLGNGIQQKTRERVCPCRAYISGKRYIMKQMNKKMEFQTVVNAMKKKCRIRVESHWYMANG